MTSFSKKFCFFFFFFQYVSLNVIETFVFLFPLINLNIAIPTTTIGHHIPICDRHKSYIFSKLLSSWQHYKLFSKKFQSQVQIFLVHFAWKLHSLPTCGIDSEREALSFIGLLMKHFPEQHKIKNVLNPNACCRMSAVRNVSKRGAEGELKLPEPLSTKAFCGFIYNTPPWKSIVLWHSRVMPDNNWSLQQTKCSGAAHTKAIWTHSLNHRLGPSIY